MIPISRDQKITKKIDGVVYTFLPPVGDLEIDIIFSAQLTGDVFDQDLGKYYDEAVKILKKNGKRKPTEEQIKKQIMTMLPKENTGKRQAKDIDNLINKTCVGWASDKELPEFKEGDCAADMGFSLKRELYEWYWEQINLGEAEAKN